MDIRHWPENWIEPWVCLLILQVGKKKKNQDNWDSVQSYWMQSFEYQYQISVRGVTLKTQDLSVPVVLIIFECPVYIHINDWLFHAK